MVSVLPRTNFSLCLHLRAHLLEGTVLGTGDTKVTRTLKVTEAYDRAQPCDAVQKAQHQVCKVEADFLGRIREGLTQQKKNLWILNEQFVRN